MARLMQLTHFSLFFLFFFFSFFLFFFSKPLSASRYWLIGTVPYMLVSSGCFELLKKSALYCYILDVVLVNDFADNFSKVRDLMPMLDFFGPLPGGHSK